jgi:hypothetical protein
MTRFQFSRTRLTLAALALCALPGYAESSLPTHTGENAATQPVHLRNSVTSLGFGFGPIPAGKRLVVEFVAFACSGPLASFAIGDGIAQLQLSPVSGDGPHLAQFLRLYVGPGQVLSVVVPPQIVCDVDVIGHFVNVP